MENRARILNNKEEGSGRHVTYWMSRDQRVEDNWALLFAQELALQRSASLSVLFCLDPHYPSARKAHFEYMLSGLNRCQVELARKNIAFHLIQGEPAELVPAYVKETQTCLLVSDFSPLSISQKWKETVEPILPVRHVEVDARNIVPCFVASNKKEYGAYTIRPKIHRLLDHYLTDIPPLQIHPHLFTPLKPVEDHTGLLKEHPLSLDPKDILKHFLDEKLEHYHLRNDPNADVTSRLSAPLHFGQISSQRVALEVMRTHKPEHGFLEELIVRRELADNFCFYEKNYTKVTAFPDWALKTLNDHIQDPRDYLYEFSELESAATHDALWNAAQNQMVHSGYMHGYMRMYWAKKILEWAPDPQTAMDYAIGLNDTYSLDGRDPNGYAGIAWSMGGVHDRAWTERPVFGKIRYMNYNGCKRKFDVDLYVKTFGKETRG